jgi:isochorismate synthase
VGWDTKVVIVPNPTVASDLRARFQEKAQRAQWHDRCTLVSITERTEPLDPIHLFDYARLIESDRFLWSQPDEGFTVAGFGIARSLDAVEESRFRQVGSSWRQLMERAIIEAPCGLPGMGPLLLGGFAFDVFAPDNELWGGYPAGRMVVPRVMLSLRNGEAWMTYNVVVGPDTDSGAEIAATLALYDQLSTLEEGPPRLEHWSGRVPVVLHELQSAAEWQSQVALTARDIAETAIEKVVLARAVRLEAERPFDVSQALERLSRNYPDCRIFAVARGERCFLGASPELLARLRNGEFNTLSLAGSTRRGVTPSEDNLLGQLLLASRKDQHEHAIVVQTLLETLSGLCASVREPRAPSLLKLRNVQHLYTPITGTLHHGVTLLDVIERLHPTPAVGGYPRDRALALIHEREGFDRGWYTGPIGWVDQNGDGEFAVAIRTAMVRGNEAFLFAGCGIVAGSDPEREYAESCLKLRPMMSALTGE